MMMKWRMTKSCRPLRGLDAQLRHIPGVPLRSTPATVFFVNHKKVLWGNEKPE
jgi:hypothetical protein